MINKIEEQEKKEKASLFLQCEALFVDPDAAGKIEAQELGLPVESTGLVLPCGSSARFIAEE